MAVSDRKLKTLLVMKILLESSDDRHNLTAADIGKELERYGLSADRRSIYDDIETLERFGLDIEKSEEHNRGWHVASRDFELPELKLLIDAVQVARFIPEQRTRALIRKLEQLTSKYQAKELHRQILLGDPPKNTDKTIYYAVDAIHDAMNRDRRLKFQYMEWTEKRQMRLRRNGKIYEVSPWGLLWDDENYYLLAYDPAIEDIKHYRVDRMRNVQAAEDLKREGEAVYEVYQKGFLRRTFGMYGGDDVAVTLKCGNRLAGVILDRFGQETVLSSDDDGFFTVRVTITESPQFFGWLTSLGPAVEILEPRPLRERYADYLKNILEAQAVEN